MTNQEAIELIKVARSEVEWEYPIYYAAAFDMAISALEAQNCNSCSEKPSKGAESEMSCSSKCDLISRQEAIRLLELERDDWETSHCMPSVRKEAFNAGIKALKDSIPKFHLICLQCRKPVGSYSKQTMEQVSYTHYSYCEDCLRQGLKLLKEQDA